MKTFLAVPGVFPDRIDADVYRVLTEAYPEGSQTNRHGVTSFSCRLPAQDPRSVAIRDALAAAIPDLDIITLRFEREYTAKDLDSVPYLSPYFSRPVGIWKDRSPEGILRKRGEDINRKAEITGTTGGPVLIADSLRSEIEAAGFVGMRLSPIEIIGSGARSLESKFWEFTSNLILPPMSAHVTYFDGCTGEEVGSDFARPYVMREGRALEEHLQSPPALRYRAADLAAMGSFDLALTYEKFGMSAPRTVVSQNVRQFCMQRNLPVAWVPVRIDAE